MNVKFRKTMGVLAGVCIALGAQAQVNTQTKDDALYRALGERAGLTALMDGFVDQLAADPRIGKHFKDTNRKHLKQQLGDQLCAVSGGPCKYEGADMKAAHEQMDITRADFNALVELLQIAMQAQGIAFSVQNQLLARLAPMHRDVITVR